jgi:hypothetical protein
VKKCQYQKDEGLGAAVEGQTFLEQVLKKDPKKEPQEEKQNKKNYAYHNQTFLVVLMRTAARCLLRFGRFLFNGTNGRHWNSNTTIDSFDCVRGGKTRSNVV